MSLVLIGNRRKGPSSWAKAAPGGLGLGIFRWTGGTLAPLGTALPDLSIGMTFHDKARDLVYALDEALTLPGWPMGGGGQIVVLRPDRAAGTLTEIARSPSYGTLPAYATQDSTGRFLLVTHHTGHTPVTRTETAADGSLRIVLDYDEAATVLFPLAPDGTILPPCDVLRHQGRGALPGQTHPQLHSVVRAPGGDLFVVCDKGADRLHILSLDHREQRLRQVAEVACPPGSSPRYAVFHPHLPLFFVNFETAALLHAYALAPDGTVRLMAETPVPGGGKMQSDLIVNADGTRLHTLVRGIEAVTTFALAPDTGLPQHLSTRPMPLDNLRGAAMDPSGRFLCLAGVLGQSVTVHPLGADGLPGPEVDRVAQPAPGNILFL